MKIWKSLGYVPQNILGGKSNKLYRITSPEDGLCDNFFYSENKPQWRPQTHMQAPDLLQRCCHSWKKQHSTFMETSLMYYFKI